jgi:hypothetical protein
MFRQISPGIWLPCNSRDLLHAANLRHGTDSFTSSSKEGVLRIFWGDSMSKQNLGNDRREV